MTKLWGGFTDGKIGLTLVDDFFDGKNLRDTPAIFLTRTEARKQYKDVRQVEIHEVKARK